MDLTETDIHEFIKLWEQEYGETLTLAEARLEGSNLLTLFSLIARPLPHEPNYDTP